MAVPQALDPQPQSNPAKDLVEVTLSGPAEASFLFQVASDPHDHQAVAADGKVHIFADDAEQNYLSSLGFRLRVLQEDLTNFYAERAAADPLRTVGGSMGGFKTLAEIEQELDRLSNTYPNIVSPKFAIGTSVQGRSIWAIRVSDNPTIDETQEPVAYFDALHHAREPMSGESLTLYADYLCQNYGMDEEVTRMVESRNIVFVPCVNPDGYEYNRQIAPNGGGLWRKNRRNNGGSFGVDLNRNYGHEWGSQWSGSSGNPTSDIYRGPSAFSEPETRACRDLLAAHPPGMSISAHCFGNLWIYSWGYDTVFTPDNGLFRSYSQAMTAQNGWSYGTAWEVLYTANGGSDDWHYAAHGSFAFTPEIGGSSDGFWPAPSRILPLFDAVRPAYDLITKWTGGWLETEALTWQEVSGDGDAYQEPGETWDLFIEFENGGVDSVTAGLNLSSNSVFITVLSGSANVTVGAQGSNQSSGLRVRFESNAQTGVGYSLDLDLTYDTVTSTEELEIVLGRPRLLASDNMQSNDFGWAVSNSTNYSWERANPEQTTSGGQTVQSGVDNPAGTGTLCWVTGAAAGGSAGTNDVDGTTILTSPRFYTSGFSRVELTYARWFANQPGGPLDDRLLVQVSNNGGSNWTTLEEIPNANSWQTVSFNLSDYVALTDNMQIRFNASDNPNNDLTEALLDDVEITAFSELPTLGIWGEISLGTTVELFVDGTANSSYEVLWSFSAGSGTVIGGVDGLLYLEGNISNLVTGATDSEGRASLLSVVPNKSVLSGRTVHLQALVDNGGPNAAYSNLLSVIVQ